MNNDLPKVLYKYKTINCYTKKLLTDNELYFSFPQDFNDPFDCFIVQDYYGDKEDWRKYLDRMNLPKEYRKRVEKMLDGLNYDNKKIKEILPNIIRTNDNDLTLLYCLTTNYDNILMWSHYADEHKGICLGFKTKEIKTIVNKNYCGLFKREKEIRKIYLEAGECIPIGSLLSNTIVPIWKVQYGKLPEAYNGLKQPSSETIKFLKTKAQDWKYENEYRCILFYPYINKQNIKFAKEILAEVIIGMRTNEKDKNEIITIVKENYIDNDIDVKLKQAVQCQTDYKILIEDIKL